MRDGAECSAVLSVLCYEATANRRVEERRSEERREEERRGEERRGGERRGGKRRGRITRSVPADDSD